LPACQLLFTSLALMLYILFRLRFTFADPVIEPNVKLPPALARCCFESYRSLSCSLPFALLTLAETLVFSNWQKIEVITGPGPLIIRLAEV